jgi:magnesium transporter
MDHQVPSVAQRAVIDEEDDNLFELFYDDQGSIPGTLKIEPDATPSTIELIDYNTNNRVLIKLLMPEECIPYLDTESVSWVDVSGLGSEDILQRMAKVFNLHPILIEDVVNVPQRPKVDEYEEHLLIISQMVMPKPNYSGFWIEQVSLILGKHYLLTVQEEPERDCFDQVRDRIRTNKGNICKQGADYLTYTLLDAIIDGFFPVLEAYGERIEELEDEVVTNPSKSTLEKIYRLRRELLALRRCIWPQRDAINILIRDGSSLISDEVKIYMRDCYDHTVQVMDMVETYRELTSGLMDVYLSSVSNKMNEIMKLLTVISSIFIPLTFIAGVYGMNFNTARSPLNMPELDWYWGYPLCWLLMIGVSGSLIYFFWKRGWFNDHSTLKE